MRKVSIVAALALSVAAVTPVLAQDTVDPAATTTAVTPPPIAPAPQPLDPAPVEDDDDFPWGLLGLLGLAGLLGRKRDDRVRH